jgi:hypothetical protein
MDLAIEGKRDNDAQSHESICDGSNQEDIDSLDEMFAAWESDELVGSVR